MTLRLKAYERASDASFEDAWARLGEQAEARGLSDEKLEALLREIDAERDAEGGTSDSHLGDVS